MKVLIAGAHGKTARRLTRMLVADGHEVRGMVRKEEQSANVESDGAEPVLVDLENAEADVGGAVAGCDAVVFAAGAGPGSGAARKETMDYGGAVRLIEAAEQHGAGRYLMLSAVGAGDPEAGSEAMRPYLRAKAKADERLAESGLAWTIVRPGGLTEDEGTGLVDAAASLGRRGEIPREDVAATFAAVLEAPNTVGKTFELLSGETPIGEAIGKL